MILTIMIRPTIIIESYDINTNRDKKHLIPECA